MVEEHMPNNLVRIVLHDICKHRHLHFEDVQQKTHTFHMLQPQGVETPGINFIITSFRQVSRRGLSTPYKVEKRL